MVAAGSVGKDLAIIAYKPKQSFDKKFLEFAGEGLEEEFIKMHLSHLKVEPSVERMEQPEKQSYPSRHQIKSFPA